jgi:hypothetical protein
VERKLAEQGEIAMDLQKFTENAIKAIQSGTQAALSQVVDVEFDVPVSGGDSGLMVDLRGQGQTTLARLKFQVKVKAGSA